MFTTELIQRLQEIVDREGDLPVYYDDDEAEEQLLIGMIIEPADLTPKVLRRWQRKKLPKRIMLLI